MYSNYIDQRPPSREEAENFSPNLTSIDRYKIEPEIRAKSGRKHETLVGGPDGPSERYIDHVFSDINPVVWLLFRIFWEVDQCI